MFVWNTFVLLLCLSFRYYGHNTLVSLTLVEVYHTVYESIKCVVLTDTYVVAGIVLSAALANNNVVRLAEKPVITIKN